ncbi:CLUMA_CG004103, isoform A [Clunio marinus]|uniref:CLUMA_CG004103, isoform A n=1 Tax=Clunio marinus TaxID=568069 RepID=A0A1J1HS27_9DIPT|nr:CLUMA_CG004103, isoform A [Clunio marinus]
MKNHHQGTRVWNQSNSKQSRTQVNIIDKVTHICELTFKLFCVFCLSDLKVTLRVNDVGEACEMKEFLI